MSKIDLELAPFTALRKDYGTRIGNNRIVSLWDMLQIGTQSFMTSLTFLGATLGEYNLMIQIGRHRANFVPNSPVESRAHVIKAIQNLQEICEAHGLKVSAKTAAASIDACAGALAGDGWYHPDNLQTVVTNLDGLLKSAVFEAESRKFYVLDADVDEEHDSPDALFGPDVIDAFPDAAFDISEAGKCQAFGLWTASVMHIMRVLETSVNALAKHVGVASSDNWNKTLNEIEVALRKVNKKADGIEAEVWAAEAGTHLRFIKNAWRNQSMHHGSKYDEAEAKQIFANARAFMAHLAERIDGTL